MLPEHYRYEFYDWYDGGNIHLFTFTAIKETPAGYWIKDKDNDTNYFDLGLLYKPKWVPKHSRKRFAYPTKEEAMTSFIKRKAKQIKILSEQLYQAKRAYKAATGADYQEPFLPNHSIFA